MKKKYVSTLLIFGMTVAELAGVNTSSPSTESSQTKKEEPPTSSGKYEILHRDGIDSTDTLAIPFDDSEIEDEEQINRDERKNVFPLPHSR